jgi:hypothetical protein
MRKKNKWAVPPILIWASTSMLMTSRPANRPLRVHKLIVSQRRKATATKRLTSYFLFPFGVRALRSLALRG